MTSALRLITTPSLMTVVVLIYNSSIPGTVDVTGQPTCGHRPAAPPPQTQQQTSAGGGDTAHAGRAGSGSGSGSINAFLQVTKVLT